MKCRSFSVGALPCSGVAVFLWAVLTLWQTTSAEIPARPDVPTSKIFKEQHSRHLECTLLEPYRVKRDEQKKVANDDDPADKFMRLYISLAEKQWPELEPLENQAKLAVDAGATDPMFSYCYGRILEHHGKLEESVKYLHAGLDGLETQGYDDSFSASAARHLRLVLLALKRNEEANPLAEREIAYLTKTVADGPYLPEEQRQLYDHVAKTIDQYPIEAVQPIVEAINQHLYPWVYEMASGQLETRRAWQARGGGWAANVTEEGWKGFEQHMVAARDHLTEAWTLNPEWPEPASKMIGVVMAGHGAPDDSERLWFDRAVAAEFDYLPAYQAMLWSLMPRWGGSHQELYALGRECLDTRRFDTSVPLVYMQAFNHIVTDIGSTYDYYKTPGVYEYLQTLAD
jgi:hypothetical protein